MRSSKFRIIYVITALNVGGAETMLYRMLEKINREQYDVTVITLRDEGIIGKRISCELNIEVINLNLQHGFKPLFSLYKFVKMVKKLNPDILHAHMFHANILIRLTRLFNSRPVIICTIHNINEKGRHKSAVVREYLYRFTDGLCDFTSHVSRAGKDKFVRIKAVPENKIEYIPNGIDLSISRFESEQLALLKSELRINKEFIFLAVGSLTKQKDYPNLLKAFAAVNNNYKNTILLIAGDGPLKREIEAFVDKILPKKSVLLLGIREDIMALMNMADVFVLSSAWEGLPIVLLEAAASGLPLIATNVGGNSEIVRDRKTGILVDSGNSEQLSSAMIEMIEMKEDMRRRLGIEARELVKARYSINAIMDKWDKIYKELLGEVI
jgi:glycosyltransferase involved in cell wall biosynthesis